MSLLSNAQQTLIDHTIQLWKDRRMDIEIADYPSHFEDMGDLIAVIESYNSFGDLITDIEKGKFEVLGYFPGEEDTLREFLAALEK